MNPRMTPDLARLLALVAAMHHGSEAMADRLDELAPGYPRGGNGARGGAELTPTEAAAANAIDGTNDPAGILGEAWARHMRKSLAAAEEAWVVYRRAITVRPGLAVKDKLADPGCELCGRIPCGDQRCERCPALDAPHWCPIYASVEVPTEARKGQQPGVRIIGLCVSCYEFQRPLPRGAGRLPTHGEVLDHAMGIRRKRTVPA